MNYSSYKNFKWHTNLVMDIQLQHFDAKKKTMRLEQELHHEKWKVRCLTRQAKAIAKSSVIQISH